MREHGLDWESHIEYMERSSWRENGALEELDLLNMDGVVLSTLAWAPHSRSALAGRLPLLHTIRVRSNAGGHLAS